MAVYTEINDSDLISFLESYDLGGLKSFEGIAAGVSNTNYHLYTDKGHYILTLFEPHRVDIEEIPEFLAYTSFLQERGIPCPEVYKTKEGEQIKELCGRPAIISEFLKGDHGRHYQDAEMCRKAGALIGNIHKKLEGFEYPLHENKFGFDRWVMWYESNKENMDSIEENLQVLTKSELDFIKTAMPQDLPKGAIHADLFPDNMFFLDGEVSGLIDFHFVCKDFYAFDLAIMVNAWCFDPCGTYVPERYNALVSGYESARPLNEDERQAFPVLLRAAALRFLMSRIDEYLSYDPEKVEMRPHDPLVFAKRLKTFQALDKKQAA